MRYCSALFLFMFMSLSIMCYSQTQDKNPNVTPEPTPAPYEDKEFPQWMKDLRRAEVLMVGSFPFTFFFAIEFFDIYRYTSNNFSAEYTPWPFKSSEAPSYTPEEKNWIIITAVSLSVSIAIVDYIIVKIKKGRNPISTSKK